jgi:transposase InsO family protein
MNLATPLTLARMCALNGVSRAGFYRWSQAPEVVDRDIDLRDEIQKIALAMPCYGWRRIIAELRRRGWKANHKRVKRLMRADDLLCVRRRKFLGATDSNHPYPVYPNLARDMKLTRLNQLWVADITYIRLELEFVYLAVILDAFSRRVVGWGIGSNIGSGSGHHRLAGRARRPSAAARLSPSFRPRRTVRLPRLYRTAEGSRHHHQHEPQRKSL